MDCKRCRKYIGAFADGELEVHHNLEVLEHLRMCPSCASRAAETTALKESLRRAYADVRASETLRERIIGSLDDPVAPRESTARKRKAAFVSRYVRPIVPLGLAAGLLILLVYWPGPRNTEPKSGALTVVTGRIFEDVREQHRMCTSPRGLQRHISTPSPDSEALARRLQCGPELSALVPDLEAYDLKLLGGDCCGIRGRPGAHVLYRSQPSGPMLSVFSTSRLPDIAPGVVSRGDTREFFVADGSPNVVAWNQGRETYVLCGAFPLATLVDLAEGVRTARVDPPSAGGPLLAFASAKQLQP